MWWVRREREKCGGQEGRGRSVVGEKCGGRKGEREVWWEEGRGRSVVGEKGEGEVWWVRSVVGGREREKCGG